MINNELCHYGKLGMRWGHRRSKKQVATNRQSNLEKVREEKNSKKIHDDEKQVALAKGSAKDILKFKGELSNTEMQNALSRINLEKQLSEISARETKTGMDKVNNIMDKVDKINTSVNKGIGAYNTVAKINNSISDKKIPVLDGADRDKEKNKNKLIKSGTPEEIVKNFGKLNVKDLEDISKRMNYEEQIRKKVKRETD